MIISICGYNCSGSSAVIHLLKEYSNTRILDFECMLLDLPDGIADLDAAVHVNGGYFRADRAFSRFLRMVHNHRYLQNRSKKQIDRLAEEYIDKLSAISWKGRSIYDYAYLDNIEKYAWFFKRLLEKVVFSIGKIRCGLTNRTMRMRDPNCDFYQATRDFLDNAIVLFGGQLADVNVMDQLLPPVHTEQYLQYLNDGKAIIVDRDPRDMYLNLNLGVDCRCTPLSAREFIDYHKLWWEKKSKVISDQRILRIYFEDLIYNYEETIKKIEDFIGCIKHLRSGEVFHPEKSINNTQIFRRVKGYEKDIEQIERELQEYLYDFPQRSVDDLAKSYRYSKQTISTNDKYK